jgi:hypothetical protein
MTAPPPPPPSGWYPDPGGANTQRYFNGTKWTDQFAPFNPPSGRGPLPPPKSQPQRPAPAKSPRPFVIMAIAGLVTAIVTHILSMLAFNATEARAEPGSFWFPVIGSALFLVFLAGIAATTVGIIAAVVRIVKQRRSG